MKTRLLGTVIAVVVVGAGVFAARVYSVRSTSDWHVHNPNQSLTFSGDTTPSCTRRIGVARSGSDAACTGRASCQDRDSDRLGDQSCY
jgi:hypothetical protein